MKKLIIAGALALTVLSFSSCDPNGYKCWKFTVVAGATTTEYYFWGTRDDVDLQLKVYEQIPGEKNINYQQTFLSKDECASRQSNIKF